jgi:hypothetical protein
MKTLGNIFGVLVALALTAVLGYGGYSAAMRFAALFGRLDFQAAVVTATATGALLLAAVIIAASIRRAGAYDRNSRLRADKAQVYKLFIGLWEEILRAGQSGNVGGQVSPQIQELGHLLAMYGSTTVVKAHAAMQSLHLPEARAQFAGALLAIRQDLGVESHGLDAKYLIQFVLGESGDTGLPARPAVLQDTQPRVSLVSNS